MDKPAAAWRQRNSRWTRDPIIDSHGPAVAYLTERDIAVFNVLARYRYLPADYIHRFVGGNAKALARRLNLLSRKPNLYLARPPQQRESATANYRFLIYELDNRGHALLRERGMSLQPRAQCRNFAHELMVAQIAASLELGTREHPHVHLISWQEILANPTTPQATRQSSNPASIPVAFTIRGERISLNLTADLQPFGLERMIDGRRTYLFFPGVEADCATEPLDPSDPARSSIAKKIAAYAAIAEQRIYQSHFGFPNFLVPFVTSNVVRMESMMKLVEKMIMGGSKLFLFKTLPTFASAEKPPPAGGQMLTTPWQRAGHPPLLLTS